jgi:arginine transport system permease protein
MNEIFPLASAAGMTVGLAVCALIIGLVLAMFFAVWESAKWFPVAWTGSALVTVLRGYRKFWWSCLSISAPHSCC